MLNLCQSLRATCSTQTLSCASVRALVRSNTVGLLKRASLERKKSDGAYRASGQRHPIALRYRSCSWDVFPYDLFPNQLRPTDLLLGQVSIFPFAPLGFA